MIVKLQEGPIHCDSEEAAVSAPVLKSRCWR
jgi:hypothetical protein